MKTRRLISNISYNSEAFLRSVAASLVSSGVADYVHWIRHEPEEDERKAHFHVLLQPSRAVDTHELGKLFREVDLTAAGKFLGVTDVWRPSKADDWLLYSVHHAGYLRAKGQTRKLHYSLDDISSTSPDFLRVQWREINLAPYELIERLRGYASQGTPWQTVLASGEIPIRLVYGYREFYLALMEAVKVKKPVCGYYLEPFGPTAEGCGEAASGGKALLAK